MVQKLCSYDIRLVVSDENRDVYAHELLKEVKMTDMHSQLCKHNSNQRVVAKGSTSRSCEFK